MLRGLYTAYTGMEAQQQKMDIVSNNLANANTSGFKQDNVVFKSFSEVLAIKINDPESKSNEQVGSMTLGVQIDNVYTNFEQGALNLTEDPLNLAIEGDGMLVVAKQNEDGSFEERYTRDGSLTVSQNGELITKDGFYVLGQEGIITLPQGQWTVSQDGSIQVNNEVVDKIQLTGFDNLLGLKKIGDSQYEMTDQTEKTEFTGALRQGYQEASNVNSVKEMIEMIGLQRIYEANQKVLSTYDETLDNVVNNVGKV
jgi:flagellar basal-body rod protein FlgG